MNSQGARLPHPSVFHHVTSHPQRPSTMPLNQQLETSGNGQYTPRIYNSGGCTTDHTIGFAPQFTGGSLQLQRGGPSQTIQQNRPQQMPLGNNEIRSQYQNSGQMSPTPSPHNIQRQPSSVSGRPIPSSRSSNSSVPDNSTLQQSNTRNYTSAIVSSLCCLQVKPQVERERTRGSKLLSVLSTGPRPLGSDPIPSLPLPKRPPKISTVQLKEQTLESILIEKQKKKQRRLLEAECLVRNDVLPIEGEPVLDCDERIQQAEEKKTVGHFLMSTIPLPLNLSWQTITASDDTANQVLENLRMSHMIKKRLIFIRNKNREPSSPSDSFPTSRDPVLRSSEWQNEMMSVANRFVQYRDALQQLPLPRGHPLGYLPLEVLFPFLFRLLSQWSSSIVQQHPRNKRGSNSIIESTSITNGLPTCLYFSNTHHRQNVIKKWRQETLIPSNSNHQQDTSVDNSNKGISDSNNNSYDDSPVRKNTSCYGPSLIVLDDRQIQSFQTPIDIIHQRPPFQIGIGDAPTDFSECKPSDITPTGGITNDESPVLWGESVETFDGKIALSRYRDSKKLVDHSPDVPKELQALFEEIDHTTEKAVALQRSLQHSFAAFNIQSPAERLLAFGALLLDQNGSDMFFTPDGKLLKKRKRNMARHIVDDGISPQEIESEEDVSSGSLSDVVDDGGTAVLGDTPTCIPMAGEESTISERKNELKKRRQEKEQRIRLALMGLAPQVTGGKTDDKPDDVGAKTLETTASLSSMPFLNPISDYRELRYRFRNATSLEKLRISFDDEIASKDPYTMPSKSGMEQRSQLEFRHSSPAFHFTGVPTQPFLVYINRFHRPDFRWGLYEAHMATQITTHIGTSKTTPISRSSFVLNFGPKRSQSQFGSGGLWGRWIVKAPRMSDVLRRAKSIDDGLAGRVHAEGNDLQTRLTHSGISSSHPSDLISSTSDLTLGDLSPIALFEHAEQMPSLLNNIGMAAKVIKFYRPSVESMTLQQAKKKIKGRLGRFGPLKLTDSYIPFFGSQMKVAKNQAVVLFQSRLYKAPIFPHPTNPHRVPSTAPDGHLSDWRYGISRFHDFRATDFLLLRRPIIQPSVTGSREVKSCMLVLRPIYMENGPDLFEDDNEDDNNRAACTIFTVGQTQPLHEVPSPTSKKCVDIRRDWLRAYALRLAREGITDFVQVKSKCQAKFLNIFEPGVLQKHIAAVRDPSSLHSAIPGHQQYQGLLRVLDEDQIRQICSPESLCCLESSLVLNSQLQQTGLNILRSADRISTAVQEIDAEEALVRDKASGARRQLKAHELQYNKLIRLMGSQLPQNIIERLQRAAQSAKAFTVADFPMSITALSGTRRLGPIARLIEEMLLLTPWNLTKECLEVTNKQGGQFSLDGIGDPSGGRGEGLSLIRLQRRDGNGRTATTTKSSASAPTTSKEDLRKLSMKQLHDRLIKLGFDDKTVKSLPRWDQVALVRRFQNEDNTDDSLIAKSGRMSNDAYVRRINEIFLSQRKALEPDNPFITQSESDNVTEQLEEALLEKALDEDGDGSYGGSSCVMAKANGSNVSFDNQTTSLTMKEKTTKNTRLEKTNLEAELLSGLEVGSDEGSDGDNLAPKDRDAAEKKALEELRRSLGRVQNLEVTATQRIAQKYTPEELRLLRAKPIPRLRWSRRSRDSRTGEFKTEKIVYIYGEENIKLFYEWRKRRIAQKRFLEGTGGMGHVGTASRTCRRCGQVGHISSNPICPKYSGPRKSRVIAAIGSQLPKPALGTPSSLSDEEDKVSRMDIEKDLTGKGKGKRCAGTSTTEKATKTPRTAKSKDASSSAGVKTEENHTRPLLPPAPKLPTRTTARQRHLLESKGSLVSGAVQSFQGSYEEALTEMNQIFQRVISKTDKERRKWILFKDQVKDSEAPGYSKMVTTPMWLDRMVEKCKGREYDSSAAFLKDVQLIIDNCYKYNPSGHWIRPIADSLGEFLGDEMAKQGPWLTELDRFIQQYLSEQQETILSTS